jgi:RNA polymerase sigma factor (sigma-70 family)
MLRPGCAAGLSDQQLLDRFIAERDEACFEVLLWRHGPTVLSVCRRILRHEQDAEDAFQATFLILVRKARSIGKRQALASWLYRVAYRVALRARLRVERRTEREKGMPDIPASEAANVVWRDLRPVLDEEIDRLPEKYRAPFVLCYLAGKTNEQAAVELGCPKGTVLSRLAWARQRLRVRLTRRGVGLTGGMISAATVPLADAALPARLVQASLKVALPAAAGKVAVSASVASLTQGALQAMFWTKIKIGVIVMLAGALLVGTAGLTRPLWAARTTDDSAPNLARPADRQAVVQQAPHEDAPARTSFAQAQNPTSEQSPVQGGATGEAKAKPEEKTYAVEFRETPWSKVFEWYSDTSRLPFVSAHVPKGTVTFVPPKDKRYTVGEITDIINDLLISQNFLLVRRKNSCTLLPTDAPIPADLFDRVSPEELKTRGKTELVRVIVPLQAHSAKGLATELKKLSGRLGSLVPLERVNQLIIQDTADNVRVIAEIIQSAEAREAGEKK